MKNRIKKRVLIVQILLIVIAVLGVINWKSNRTDMKFVTEGKIVYVHNDIDISHNLNNEELNVIKGIFQDKKIHKENYSCGFSEDVSIIFNESQTFCIANDTCSVIFWKEKNKYISITDDEKQKLYDIFEKYGGSFPCV